MRRDSAQLLAMLAGAACVAYLFTAWMNRTRYPGVPRGSQQEFMLMQQDAAFDVLRA